MRCRERHNPFTQLGKDLLAFHLYQGYLSARTAGLNRDTASLTSNTQPWHRQSPCYNSDVSRVLMVSSEAAPFAKTGGLADVVGSLPPALQEIGDQVAVVLPRYAS